MQLKFFLQQQFWDAGSNNCVPLITLPAWHGTISAQM